MEAAQGLLASMQSAPHVSARSGWLVLLQSLLRGGYHQKVCIAPRMRSTDVTNWTQKLPEAVCKQVSFQRTAPASARTSV